MFLAAEIIMLFAPRKHKEYNPLRIRRPAMKSDYIYILSCIPFLLVSILRYKIGTDYNVYSRLQIPEVMNGINDRVEFLYRYVIKLGMAMGHIHWVFVITHIMIIAIYWMAMKESDDYVWSIFIFMFGCYFNLSLNIMRQFIAMGLALYALKYIWEKRFWHFAVLIVIATLFHSTAIVFIVLYPLAFFDIPRYLPLIVSAGCFLVSKIARGILMKLTSIVTVYESYLDSQYDKMDTQWDYIILNMFILVLLLVWQLTQENTYQYNMKSSFEAMLGTIGKALTKTKVDYTERETLKWRTLVWMQFITTVFACFSSIIPNSTRIIILMSQGQLLFVPMLLKRLRFHNDLQRIIKVGLIMIYILIFYRKIVFANYGQTVPYQSIFSA